MDEHITPAATSPVSIFSHGWLGAGYVLRKRELVDLGQAKKFVKLKGFLRVLDPQHGVVELPATQLAARPRSDGVLPTISTGHTCCLQLRIYAGVSLPSYDFDATVRTI